MEASRVERSGYLTPSRLTAAELMGMVSAVILFLSLFLSWFTTSETNPNSTLAGASGGESVTAWETFGIMDWLLVAACSAPFILAWIIARGHKLTWKPGEVTMIVGITAFVLILINGIVLGKPGDTVDVEFRFGDLVLEFRAEAVEIE